MPPPLSSIIRAAVTAVRTLGVRGAWHRAKENNLGAGLWDGGLLVMKLKNADGATFKGIDRFGNKYWEKTEDTLHGRHRWVDYASPWNYEATNVPPEWHGWLHHITDHTADQLEELKSKRLELAIKEEAKYMAKGHVLHPHRRIWQHYETWQPSGIDQIPVSLASSLEGVQGTLPKKELPVDGKCQDF